MPKITQRMLTTMTGKRSSLKLDQPTWLTIDWLAKQRGQSWQEWCNQALANVTGDENMTGTLREAAMAGLLGATVLADHADRAEQVALQESHALMRNSAPMDDALLKSTLKRANVQGRSDFGGFEILFGFDEYGTDCIWIKNRLRDGVHFAIQAS
ncbi:MAG: hypothetical protein ACXU8N_10875 [Telluria sp.]